MPAAESKQNRLNLIALILSALGILVLFVQGVTLLLVAAFSAFADKIDGTQLIPVGTLAWTSILLGLLLAPVLILSLRYWKGQPAPSWLDKPGTGFRKWILGLIFLWLLLILLGYWLVGKPTMATFLLGPINFFVVGVPILLILTVSHLKLDGGSRFRQWGIFGVSITVTPSIIMLVEIAAILILVLFGGVWMVYKMSINPSIEQELMYIMDQVMISGQDPEALLQLLKPYILQPSVLVWAGLVFGGLVPMIEELFKPLALWLMAGRKISPQEGFIGGLLCGAGFALLENLLYFSMASTPEDWLYMALGRAGTGVLHMLGSGLIGWGLAKTWRDGKGWHLAVTLVAAFLFHGLWNVLALAVGVVPLFSEAADPSFWQQLALNAPTILLLILSIGALFWVRRRVRREAVLSIEDDSNQILEEEGGAIV